MPYYQQAGRDDGEAIVVCLSPCICYTPRGDCTPPIPYMISANLGDEMNVAQKCNFNGNKAFTMSSRITACTGNEAGTAGGIQSGVNVGFCRPITYSPRIRVEGACLIRDYDLFEMNCAGPDGSSNIVGQLFFQSTQKARSCYTIKGKDTDLSVEEDKSELQCEDDKECDEQGRPYLYSSQERKESIINDTPANFPIEANPDASPSAGYYEITDIGSNTVNQYSDIIDQVASETGVDPDLISAVMYKEEAAGWYDDLYNIPGLGDAFDFVKPQKSFRPMNVNYNYWEGLVEDLGFTKNDIINDPYANIRTGAELLKRIEERIEDPTVEKVASMYNVLVRENTNDYGARVEYIYEDIIQGGEEEDPTITEMIIDSLIESAMRQLDSPIIPWRR